MPDNDIATPDIAQPPPPPGDGVPPAGATAGPPPPPSATPAPYPNAVAKPSTRQRVAAGLGGFAAGFGHSGDAFMKTPLGQKIMAYQKSRMDETAFRSSNMQQLEGKIALAQRGIDLDTGQRLSPEDQQRKIEEYTNQHNAEEAQFQKLAGVTPEVKKHLAQAKQLKDSLRAKMAQGNGQGGAQAGAGATPQPQGKPGGPPAPPASAGGAGNAGATPLAAPQGPPQPPSTALAPPVSPDSMAGKAMTAQATNDEWTRRQSVVSANKIKEDAAKVQAEKDAKIAEEKAKPPATPKPTAATAPLGPERVSQLNQASTARWNAANPGKPMPPSFLLQPDATQKDYDNVSKLMNETAQAAVKQRQEAQSADLSPDAIDALAGVYLRTGQMPAMGLGGMPVRTKIFERVGQIVSGKGRPDPGFGSQIAASGAGYKALSGSLTQAQKNLTAVEAFESTSLKNLQIFENAAKKVVDEGSPWINQPLREVDAGALGSDDVVAYNTARAVALTEISRVLNNPNLTGVLSDEARKQVGALIGEGATLSNVMTASGILKQDMENRRGSLQDEVKTISGQISQGSPKAGPPSPPSSSPATKSSGGARRIVVN